MKRWEVLMLIALVAVVAGFLRPGPSNLVKLGDFALGTPRPEIEQSLAGQNWFGYDDRILCEQTLLFANGHLCAVIGTELEVGDYTLEAGEYIGEVERILGSPRAQKRDHEGLLVSYAEADVWFADGKHATEFRIGNWAHWP
ncbi:MAG: hypothetical protein AB7S38_38025 [Vulcanimicrobiota bacterium]